VEVAELLERTRPVVLAEQRALPVVPALSPVLPGGLRRGSVMSVGTSPGSTSLLLSLMSAASAGGSWCGLVGMPEVGPEAAAALGLDLGRLALVPEPGDQWPAVVSALFDGIDVVAIGPHLRPRLVEARRLAARARQASAVLLATGSQWPEGCDLALEVVGGEWKGLGHGHGALTSRRAEVAVTGRRAATRRRSSTLLLPDDSGRPEPVDDTIVPLTVQTAGGAGAGAPGIQRSRGAGDPAGNKS
jgi:hypothetical protein